MHAGNCSCNLHSYFRSETWQPYTATLSAGSKHYRSISSRLYSVMEEKAHRAGQGLEKILGRGQETRGALGHLRGSC